MQMLAGMQMHAEDKSMQMFPACSLSGGLKVMISAFLFSGET